MVHQKRWISGLTLAGFLLALFAPLAAAVQNQPATNGLVNINTADAKTLDKLPRVGPKVAERIIEYRKINGGFKRIQDLMKVKGIGEKTFEKLKGLVTI